MQFVSVGISPKCMAFVKYIKLLKETRFEKFDNEILCLLLNKVSKLVSLEAVKKHDLTLILSEWLVSLDITKLSNDDVIICVLQLFQSL